MRKLALVLALFVSQAFAQFTTVTGTVIDPHSVPYALGTITPLLVVPSGAGTPTLNGQPYSPPYQAVGLDKNGTFSFNVADNTVLLPAGTKWNFTVCSATGTVQPAIGTGPQCFNLAAPITISGASVNISTNLNAVALSLTVPLGNAGCTPAGTNQIQYNNAGACAGIPNVAAGSAIVSNGTGNVPITQTKAIFDTRDWTSCDTAPGTNTGTDTTSALGNLVSTIGTLQATIEVIGTTSRANTCLLSTVNFSSNITLDFSGGGAFTLINSVIPPGGGALDGTVVSSFGSSLSSCSVALNVPTGGDAIALLTNYRFATGGGLGLPSDTKGNVYHLVSQSDADSNHYSSNTFGWVASNVSAGSVTITIPYLAAPPSSKCAAFAVSGLGPSVGADGPGASCAASCNPNSPMSTITSATYTAGSFLVAFGGNDTTTETCTAGGAFTQILDIGVNMNLCAQIIASTAGGAITATQAISTPVVGQPYWMYNSFGLKPVKTTLSLLGGIVDSNLHQIFYQALGGQGTADFTGNLVLKTVNPEWWGAFPSNTGAQNSAPMQAAEHGAFGTNRSNASGLGVYNKQLYLSGLYQINAEIQFYHVIGSQGARWDVSCAAGGGLKQVTTNLRIWDGQSNAYGTIHSCTFIGGTSSTNALVDMDYDGVTTAPDLATQFITCYDCTFLGNGVVDTGWLLSKSGGIAQGSNIYCINCAGQAFTGAVMQVGGNNTGRNAGRFYAFNALNIGWTGDMQNCPNFGFGDYAGGFIKIDNSSFECVSPLASYLTQALSSVDVYGEATQGPVTVTASRSEDIQFVHASTPVIKDSLQIDQSTAFYSPVNCAAGTSLPLNWFMHGSDVGGDGALYQITVHGTALGGLCLTNATSGNSTTISDTNQRVAGTNPTGLFALHETVTQAVTGSTGTLLNIPISIGTVTGSVTSGTIGFGDTVTQATTAVTCTVAFPAPTGSGNLLVQNCSGAPDNSHIYTDGSTSGTYTPTSTPAFAAASPVMLITAATGSPDSSHNWTGGTSGAVLVPSAAPVNDVNFTVNQFATAAPGQQQVTIWGGTGLGTVCSPIIANTATSITFTGCTSYYNTVHAGNFDNTTQFIVEPCWQCSGGVTQSGDFTFARRDPIIIGGDNPNPFSPACNISNVTTSGGYVQCTSNNGPFTKINGLRVSRPDWSNGGVSGPTIAIGVDGVEVTRTYGTSATTGGGGLPYWRFAARSSAATNIYQNPIQTIKGTSALVWECANGVGGTICNDVTVGGRSDPSSLTDTFRNRLETCSNWTGPGTCANSMIGAPAPSAFNITDQNGSPTQIGGGPSTGAGTPGPIEFWISNTAGSGNTPNSGAKAWAITSNGNLVDQGAHSVQPAIYKTLSNCGAVGTAANPSVVACGSAPAGAFACDVAASAGTCVVNTTAVGANSQVIVQETTKENTRLGVTCNTSPTVIPAIPVASQSAGVSFTVNMPTITTNPACFDYWIVNQ